MDVAPGAVTTVPTAAVSAGEAESTLGEAELWQLRRVDWEEEHQRGVLLGREEKAWEKKALEVGEQMEWERKEIWDRINKKNKTERRRMSRREKE